MSNRPRAQRGKPKTEVAEAFIRKAFTDEIKMKAAMIVVHRVARSMSDTDPRKQREALDKLLVFTDAHPLDAELEKLL